MWMRDLLRLSYYINGLKLMVVRIKMIADFILCIFELIFIIYGISIIILIPILPTLMKPNPSTVQNSPSIPFHSSIHQ